MDFEIWEWFFIFRVMNLDKDSYWCYVNHIVIGEYYPLYGYLAYPFYDNVALTMFESNVCLN